MTDTELSHGVFSDGENMDTADTTGRSVAGILTAMTHSQLKLALTHFLMSVVYQKQLGHITIESL